MSYTAVVIYNGSMAYSGNRHQITVDGRTFWVDSNQEEHLIRWLEDNGFSKRWRRLDTGLTVGRKNYTPDLEVSVELDGMTHRALVESKPTLSAFTPSISKRMRGVAKHYFTKLLLLYVHDTNTWYRVDVKTGELSEFTDLVPGKISIAKLYKPLTVSGKKIYAHRYRERLQLGKKLAVAAGKNIDYAITTLLTPKKPRRSRRRRKK